MRKLGIKLSAAALVAASFMTSAAKAEVQTFQFTGFFGGGSALPFAVAPGTITGTITYDPTNSGVPGTVYPDGAPSTGSAGWYANAITRFNFQSLNAAPGSAISGACSSLGGGEFVVFDNHYGDNTLQLTVTASQGLNGIVPAGYRLISAALEFSGGPVFGSAALPTLASDGNPFNLYAGKGFAETVENIVSGRQFKLHASLGAIAFVSGPAPPFTGVPGPVAGDGPPSVIGLPGWAICRGGAAAAA